MDLRLRTLQLRDIPAHKIRDIYFRVIYTCEMHKLKKVLKQMVRRILREHENLSFLDDITYIQAIRQSLSFCKILTSKLRILFIPREFSYMIKRSAWRDIYFKLFELGAYITQFSDHTKQLIKTKDFHFYHQDIEHHRDYTVIVNNIFACANIMENSAEDGALI
jgi:hypothetical protein